MREWRVGSGKWEVGSGKWEDSVRKMEYGKVLYADSFRKIFRNFLEVEYNLMQSI